MGPTSAYSRNVCRNWLIKLVWWILYVAPIGVFCLAAPVTAKLGWDLVQSLGIFIVCVFVGLLIFLALVTLPLMYFVGGISPIRTQSGRRSFADLESSLSARSDSKPLHALTPRAPARSARSRRRSP